MHSPACFRTNVLDLAQAGRRQTVPDHQPLPPDHRPSPPPGRHLLAKIVVLQSFPQELFRSAVFGSAGRFCRSSSERRSGPASMVRRSASPLPSTRHPPRTVPGGRPPAYGPFGHAERLGDVESFPSLLSGLKARGRRFSFQSGGSESTTTCCFANSITRAEWTTATGIEHPLQKRSNPLTAQ